MPSIDGTHWFWWLTTAACVVWYSTITLYVAVKGAKDIKHMLRRLQDINTADAAGTAPEAAPAEKTRK